MPAAKGSARTPLGPILAEREEVSIAVHSLEAEKNSDCELAQPAEEIAQLYEDEDIGEKHPPTPSPKLYQWGLKGCQRRLGS